MFLKKIISLLSYLTELSRLVHPLYDMHFTQNYIHVYAFRNVIFFQLLITTLKKSSFLEFCHCKI